MQSTMDVIMGGAWMLSSQNAVDHLHGCSFVREHQTMDVIMVWAMDALFSERITPWTSS